MKPGTKDSTRAVGKNIRILRTARGIMGKELAERVGVTPSYLSKLERGSARLSIELMHKISDVLHVSSGDLLTPGLALVAAGAVLPGARAVSLIRADERKILRLPRYPYDYQLLTPYGHGQLELSWAELEPGTGDPEAKKHGESDEALVLLRGVLHVTVAGEDFELHPGDCLAYSSAIPHACRNDGSERAVWIWATTPPTL